MFWIIPCRHTCRSIYLGPATNTHRQTEHILSLHQINQCWYKSRVVVAKKHIKTHTHTDVLLFCRFRNNSWRCISSVWISSMLWSFSLIQAIQRLWCDLFVLVLFLHSVTFLRNDKNKILAGPRHMLFCWLLCKWLTDVTDWRDWRKSQTSRGVTVLELCASLASRWTGHLVDSASLYRSIRLEAEIDCVRVVL